MTGLIRTGNLIIDRDRYTVWVGDQPVTLTYIEFELLATLAGNRGRVLSQRQILESVWGRDDASGFKKLAVHISRLRKKIAGSYPYAIRTIAKRGYALTDVSSQPQPFISARQAFIPSSQELARGG